MCKYLCQHFLCNIVIIYSLYFSHLLVFLNVVTMGNLDRTILFCNIVKSLANRPLIATVFSDALFSISLVIVTTKKNSHLFPNIPVLLLVGRKGEREGNIRIKWEMTGYHHQKSLCQCCFSSLDV